MSFFKNFYAKLQNKEYQPHTSSLNEQLSIIVVMMDKLIFSKLFSNCVLNKLIFDQVKSISARNGRVHYKWKELLVKPHALAGHNYLELLENSLTDKKQFYPLKYIRSIFEKALSVGSVAMLDYLLRRFQVKYGEDDSTVRYSSVDPKIEMYSNLNSVLSGAAQQGRFDLINYLIATFNSHQWNYFRAMTKAPLSGDFKILDYFLERIELDPKAAGSYRLNAFNTAAYSGHIDMVKYLALKRPQDLESSTMFHYAVFGGHTQMVQYLLEEYQDRLPNEKEMLLDYAVRHNYLDIAKVLHKYGCRDIFGQDTMPIVASHGYLDTLIWLCQNTSSECTSTAMDYAARSGHLETVKWLYHNRSLGCSEMAINGAAEEGHLKVIAWIHENMSASCTTEAMDYASGCESLDVLKWLHSNRTEGCTALSMAIAARSGHLANVKWLHENRTEGATEYAIEAAATYGFLDIVKWLSENRSDGSSTEAMDQAATNCHFEVVCWLNENRTEGCTLAAVEMAASNGDLKMVKYLLENTTVGCSIETLGHALQNGELDLIEYLLENTKECRLESVPNITNYLRSLIQKNQYQTIELILQHIDVGVELINHYLPQFPYSIESIEILERYINLKSKSNKS
ncbi:hypothetical protein PPL_11844 [Heterostelium album PN500]|uniref:Ankyrin repeat protein n=1 Tax=Heterostelium pallidum (strain ATCC 26659 / Pp 5 / PN500) TaxID=670386 RepID=D3BUM3_HETP5|nr:hypothetical protein PPL_11844 [Heterostelium album PN500]EFA74811.1 hypothetical protein PPL_11844 [Heterostelium album PN500]|eukprot:XP_020426945.1 hypothetical protein PPL_11844 [Heterostelium album PN500]